MEVNEFKSRLKDGNLGGCYIFTGEEDYLKRFYLGALREKIVTDEAFAFFNHTVYDGPEVNFATISDDIKAPPMMADYKLIEWKYPSFAKMKESDLVAFEKVLALLSEYENVALAFLVAEDEIDLGTPKKPSKFIKRFEGSINILNFAKSSDAALLSWLKKHFDAEGISTSPEVLRNLLFRSGHSMSVLNEEVTKLSAYAKANGKAEIKTSDVTFVASSTPECDTFALSNALMERNKKAALIALDEMKLRRIDPIVIMGMISKTLTEIASISILLGDGMGSLDIQKTMNLHPKRTPHIINAAKRYPRELAKRVIDELCRVDTAAKFGGVSGYTAIELFITKCI